MSTYVVRVKNTSVENAFEYLRTRSDAMNDDNGKVFYIGKPKTFIDLDPHSTFEESTADAIIRGVFEDRLSLGNEEYVQKGGPALCLRLSKTEFVFFGRLQ